MRNWVHVASGSVLLRIAVGLWLPPASAEASDWPQWRGPGRDAKAAGFVVPKVWPKELVRKWQTTVGTGDATPALVEGKLYVAARQEGREVVLCLDALTGRPKWKQTWEAAAIVGPAARHSGPRSSPAVGGGKLVTCGVRGTLSCLDAATGKVLWRREEFPGAWPKFFAACSPLFADGLCVAQLGSESQGGIVAHDLATGDLKWKWTGDGSAYASPTLLTVGETRMVVALTARKIVGLGLSDGKLLWEAPFIPSAMNYNAATPVVDGQTVLYTGTGRGTKAIKVEPVSQGFAAQPLWSNPDHGVQFNSPVLKDGQVYGVSQKGDIFCLEAQSGKTLWTFVLGGRGFASIVDAGTVLVLLSPQGELVVFTPNKKEFKRLATFKVGMESYAYPILAGNGVYVKDKETVTFWGLE